MGMAASQARYLGLAARKTNCEYQGQQINQARTALANQSAELWNQMLGLSVPTVPDQTNYTKTQYSFSDGQNAYEIIDMVPSDEEDGYNYTVKYRYYEDTVNGVEVANTNPQVYADVSATKLENQTIDVDDATGKATYGGAEFVEITDETQASIIKADLISKGVLSESQENQKLYKVGNNYYVGELPTATTDAATMYTHGVGNYTLGNSKATALTVSDVQKDPNLAAALLKIAQDNPDTKMAEAIEAAYNGNVSAYPNDTSWNDAISQIYTYTKNGTVYYATKEELDISRTSFREDNSTEVSAIDKQKSLKQYYTLQQKEEKVETSRALMDDASGTGRFTSVKLKNYNTAFNLQTETATNDEAYNQAMNQYYYDTQVYNKKNADINAKTSIIQQQDRTLELRLKQLDTEHNALQTEMEAVKKVITKNVEDTFKTFNG